MRKTILVLACLAWHGQATSEQPQQQPAEENKEPLQALSNLFLAHDPTAAFQAPVSNPSIATSNPISGPASARIGKQEQRSEDPLMDETIIQTFIKGGPKALAEEGRREFWRSEITWRLYMDEKYQASYNYGTRPSLDPNWEPVTIFDSPTKIARKVWKDALRCGRDPIGNFFPTIEGDPMKSWGPGKSEITSRTIYPKEKDLSPDNFVTPPGCNLYGAGRSTDWKRMIKRGIKKWKGELPEQRSGKTKMSAVDDEDEVRALKGKIGQFFKEHPKGMAVGSVPADKVDQRARRSGQVVMRPRSNFVPDMQRRTIMNLIVLGTLAPPFAFILYCVLAYFIPPDDGGGAAGLVAKDALGNEVTFEKWLTDNQAGSRKLVQGLRGDATYLIVTEDKKIEDYGINAVCTHLGCVVPWNRAQNKFMCPCHGSQYDDTGKVVRGPAPLSLALTHVTDKGGKVTFTPWTEQDFRTGQNPWWKP